MNKKKLIDLQKRFNRSGTKSSKKAAAGAQNSLCEKERMKKGKSERVRGTSLPQSQLRGGGRGQKVCIRTLQPRKTAGCSQGNQCNAIKEETERRGCRGRDKNIRRINPNDRLAIISSK